MQINGFSCYKIKLKNNQHDLSSCQTDSLCCRFGLPLSIFVTRVHPDGWERLGSEVHVYLSRLVSRKHHITFSNLFWSLSDLDFQSPFYLSIYF